MDSSKRYSDFLLWDAHQAYQRYLEYRRSVFTRSVNLQTNSDLHLEQPYQYQEDEQSSGTDTLAEGNLHSR